MIHFEFFFLCGIRPGVNSFILCRYLIDTAPFVEESYLLITEFSYLCRTSIDHECKGLFLKSQFCSVDLHVLLCQDNTVLIIATLH